MLHFFTRKLAYGFAILIGINLLTFVLFFKVNTPEDMARMQLGGKRVTLVPFTEGLCYKPS